MHYVKTRRSVDTKPLNLVHDLVRCQNNQVIAGKKTYRADTTKYHFTTDLQAALKVACENTRTYISADGSVRTLL